jgi:hypothetical protein
LKHGIQEGEKGDFIFDANDADMGAESKAKHEKRITEKVSNLYRALYPVAPHRKFLLLDASATDPDGSPVVVPVIKFIFAR